MTEEYPFGMRAHTSSPVRHMGAVIVCVRDEHARLNKIVTLITRARTST